MKDAPGHLSPAEILFVIVCSIMFTVMVLGF